MLSDIVTFGDILCDNCLTFYVTVGGIIHCDNCLTFTVTTGALFTAGELQVMIHLPIVTCTCLFSHCCWRVPDFVATRFIFTTAYQFLTSVWSMLFFI